MGLIDVDAVHEIINDIRDCISVEGYCAIQERLKKLPTVEDKPQGEWIYKQYGGYSEQGDWYCSECGFKYNYGQGKAKYCPNCGCRMVEPQERSDKE